MPLILGDDGMIYYETTEKCSFIEMLKIFFKTGKIKRYKDISLSTHLAWRNDETKGEEITSWNGIPIVTADEEEK